MEMSKLEKVIRGLRDIDMFIAGRLEHEKAKNFLRTIDETIAMLKEQDYRGWLMDMFHKYGRDDLIALLVLHGEENLLADVLKEQEAKPLRCEECSYHRNDGWCNEHRREVKESDYCSFGAWEGR